MKALKMLGIFILMMAYSLFILWIGVQFGSEPSNAQVKKMYKCKDARDYQLELYMDTVWLYDGERLVGSYISTWKNQMDTLIMDDNQ